MEEKYSEGILLAAITILSYFIYFGYRAIFYSYYETSSLIKFEKIIGFFIVLYFLTYLIFIFMNGFYSMIPSGISDELGEKLKIILWGR